MKCPLLKITRPGLMTKDAHPQDDCLKEECAWWDTTLLTCAVSRTANRLDQLTYFMAKAVEPKKGSMLMSLKRIASSLDELVKKMPHAGQFTK